jgi:ABC-type Zn2+ transport system substrate-binding protein/surface adhesin
VIDPRYFSGHLVDFPGRLPQNLAQMQSLASFVAVAAMLVALLTSPFYHAHDHDDDHGSPASVVHAHLLEAEEHDHHSEDEFASRDGHHAAARWVDVFVFGAPATVLDLAVELAETLPVTALVEREAVVIPAVPRAHGPPEQVHSAPRAPPSI